MLAPMQSLEVVGNVDFGKYPKTTEWLKKMKNLPYYNECNNEGMEIFISSYRNALAKTQQSLQNLSQH